MNRHCMERLAGQVFFTICIATMVTSLGAYAGDRDVSMVQEYPAISSPVQTFINTTGWKYHDSGRAVEQTRDGGYIVAGASYVVQPDDGMNNDAYFVRFDPSGEILWSTACGVTDGGDTAFFVKEIIDEDGPGFVAAGSTSSSGSAGGFLMRINPKGRVTWKKMFPGNYFNSGLIVKEGGYVLAGNTGAGVPDIRLVKTDNQGSEEWTRNYDILGSLDVLGGVQQAWDGGYLLAGGAFNMDGWGNWEIFLLKTDDQGNQEWMRTFGGSSDFMACDLQKTSDQGYIIVGWTSSNPTYDVRPVMIKTDHAGNELWRRQLSGPAGGGTFATSVDQSTDGGFIVGVNYDPYIYWVPGWLSLVKTDAFGMEEWTSIYDMPSDDMINDVQLTTDGGYVFTGYSSRSHPGYGQLLIAKTDGFGCVNLPLGMSE